MLPQSRSCYNQLFFRVCEPVINTEGKPKLETDITVYVVECRVNCVKVIAKVGIVER